ncbi:hypothetical protein [Kitasatospora sp. NPDC087315]|uniref:hypothetical protein n=1 Tax=Kitasatospora sp. NPDC087315 TaxID=3364069 RepID=UPI003828B06A
MTSATPARSPLIGPAAIAAYGPLPAPGPHTAAELAALLRLLTGGRARLHTVTVGHSRDDASRAAARAFTEAWLDLPGRSVLAVVDWPEQAASWLRPARRLTAPAPDAWVLAAAPLGWAQLARRLGREPGWRAWHTFGFASLASLASLAEPRAVALAGQGALDGLRGASADGGTWEIADGRLTTCPPGRAPQTV